MSGPFYAIHADKCILLLFDEAEIEMVLPKKRQGQRKVREKEQRVREKSVRERELERVRKSWRE